MAKMMHREASRPDRADVVGRLPGETQEACQRLACDGPCETVRAWCPDCDRETEHVRISPTFRECAVCGELSEDITSVSVSVDSPAYRSRTRDPSR